VWTSTCSNSSPRRRSSAAIGAIFIMFGRVPTTERILRRLGIWS
jgi:hypothetical protein